MFVLVNNCQPLIKVDITTRSNIKRPKDDFVCIPKILKDDFPCRHQKSKVCAKNGDLKKARWGYFAVKKGVSKQVLKKNGI